MWLLRYLVIDLINSWCGMVTAKWGEGRLSVLHWCYSQISNIFSTTLHMGCTRFIHVYKEQMIFVCKIRVILTMLTKYKSAPDRVSRFDYKEIVFILPLWQWLTHWARMTHICVSKIVIIVSDNGMSPGRRNIIKWTFRNKLQWIFNRKSCISIL